MSKHYLRMEKLLLLCLIFFPGHAQATTTYDWMTTQRTTPIRLVDGYDRYSGRVEVYYRGRWGTVCDDSFDRNDLYVVCRMLGMYYGHSYGVIYTSAQYFGPGTGYIIVDDLNCNGQENDISECRSRTWLTDDCRHSEDVGVDCHATTDYSTTSIRLVGGYQRGRVEVFYNGQWGTICSDNMTHNDIKVMCRNLGYYHGDYYGDFVPLRDYGAGSGPIVIDDLQCTGNEQDISQCRSTRWGTSGTSNCGHGQDLAITCAGTWGSYSTTSRPRGTFGLSVTDGSWIYGRIRLVDGYDRYSGRVELSYNGRWGTVCDDSFDYRDAAVICKMLGFSVHNGYPAAFGNAYFGEGSGDIVLDDLQCHGHEYSIADCRSSGWGNHNCGHSEDAGVDCNSRADVTNAIHGFHDISTSGPTHRVRLVDGNGRDSGRVEIYHNGEWMSVCQNGMTYNDVRVICRELGYDYGSSYGRLFGGGSYGQSSSNYIIHSLRCNGRESSVMQCGIQSNYRGRYCSHYQDTALYCSGYRYYETTIGTSPPSTIAPDRVRLVGGGASNKGRVEVYHDNQWMTVCPYRLDHNDIMAICRSVGYYYGYQRGVERTAGYYGQSNTYNIVTDLRCNGYETSLSQCGISYSSYCPYSPNAAIDCTGDYYLDVTTGLPYWFIQTTEEVQLVRLVGSGSSYKGRVEIYQNNHWMTICPHRLDHNDIMAICKSVGHYYGYNYGVELTPGSYGQGSSSYYTITNLDCYGYEASIFQCNINYHAYSYCSHSQDAAIDCYGYYYGMTTSLPYWFRHTTEGSILEDAITVSCNEYGWDINVNMYRLQQRYPSARADAIYMGENNCVGNDDGYNVHFRQGLRQCLTSQMIRNDVLVYRNQLIYAERDPYPPYLIRHYNWTVDVECDVMRNETSSGHLHHNFGNVNSNHEVSGTSHYAVNMSFYSDPNFRYQLHGYPLNVNVGDKVYVKVFTPTADWTIKMKVHTCYTKPFETASDSQKYYIIRNGCEVDGNTHIISQSSHETRFVFQDFEYPSNHEGIYTYCDATFCPSSDYSASCSQTCNPVIRRRNLPPDALTDKREGKTTEEFDVKAVQEVTTEDPPEEDTILP